MPLGAHMNEHAISMFWPSFDQTPRRGASELVPTSEFAYRKAQRSASG